jgi:uridine kinase
MWFDRLGCCCILPLACRPNKEFLIGAPMQRLVELSGLLRALDRARGSGSGTTLVAIDGAGGSGKTSLAGEVTRQLEDCVVVHVDDFYRPMSDVERRRLDADGGYHRYFDWQRLQAQVLVPLSADRDAHYQAHDWASGDLGAWHEVVAGGLVIVEGVYSARPELAPAYDLTVFVDAPREVCLQRLAARGSSAEWTPRWRAAEDHYLETTQPIARAGFVVKGY